MNKFTRTRRVLVFRQGSMGDTVVALPCFKLIRTVFSNAKIYVLTNTPVSQKACALKMVLENMCLVDEYLSYPVEKSLIKKFIIIRKLVKQLKIEVLIYMSGGTSSIRYWRDFLFFKFCGVKKIIGPSLISKKSKHLYDKSSGSYEYEGKRLARQLEPTLGPVNWNDPNLMNLELTSEEHSSLEKKLLPWMHSNKFIVCSIGTKLVEKDWGQKNWLKFITQLAPSLKNIGLVFIGTQQEAKRSQALLDLWQGPTANLCGQLSVRESACLLERCKLFIGHDSGPMHLAAAAGACCVTIFGRHNKPKMWYPYGDHHYVIYPPGKTIQSISVGKVVQVIEQAIREKLGELSNGK